MQYRDVDIAAQAKVERALAIEAAGGAEAFIAALRELLADVDVERGHSGDGTGEEEWSSAMRARALLAKLPAGGRK